MTTSVRFCLSVIGDRSDIRTMIHHYAQAMGYDQDQEYRQIADFFGNCSRFDGEMEVSSLVGHIDALALPSLGAWVSAARGLSFVQLSLAVFLQDELTGSRAEARLPWEIGPFPEGLIHGEIKMDQVASDEHFRECVEAACGILSGALDKHKRSLNAPEASR